MLAFLASCGNDIKADLLPPVVVRFIERDGTTPFETDADHFEALLACTAAMERVRYLKRNATAALNTAQEYYADPSAEFFEKGRDLCASFQRLYEKLDGKRRDLVGRMGSPPVIESLLDAMEATEVERQLFYTVLVGASDALTTSDKQASYMMYGDGRVAGGAPYVSWLATLDVCSEFLTFQKLTTLTSIGSKWVKEHIYQKSDQPTMMTNLNNIDGSGLRCLTGAPLSVEQYHAIDSPLLQKVLLENARFLETETGKTVHSDHVTFAAPTPQDFDAVTDEGKPSVVNDLTEQLAKLGSNKPKLGGDGNIFHIIGEMQQMQMNAMMGAGKEATFALEDEEEDDGIGGPGSEETKFGPYKSELDYIQDQFKLSDDMLKLQGMKTLSMDTLDSYQLANPYTGVMKSKEEVMMKNDIDKEKLEVKFQKFKKRVETRIRATEQQRGTSPRLEQLSEALELGSFERFVLLDLIRETLDPNPMIRSNTRQPMMMGRVDSFISRYATTLEGKMRCRTCFYKSSPLISEGIITLSGQDFATDLNQCKVNLDRRMFDYIIAMDTELSELVDGSHLYEPTVRMEDVVLPTEIKDRICDRALHFDAVRQKYGELGISKKITYGLGQVFLFFGHSGA